MLKNLELSRALLGPCLPPVSIYYEPTEVTQLSLSVHFMDTLYMHKMTTVLKCQLGCLAPKTVKHIIQVNERDLDVTR